MSDDQATSEPDVLLAYIERLAGVLADSGVPRMPSRVFAALLVTDSGRLTSTELSDLLGISPAAVSGAVRYLTQVNLITRERAPRSRRDRYRVLDEVWQDAILSRGQVLARYETSLAEGVSLLGADTPAGRRLSESVRMFRFLRRELQGMTARWFAERDVERGGAGGGGASGGQDSGQGVGRDVGQGVDQGAENGSAGERSAQSR